MVDIRLGKRQKELLLELYQYPTHLASQTTFPCSLVVWQSPYCLEAWHSNNLFLHVTLIPTLMDSEWDSAPWGKKKVKQTTIIWGGKIVKNTACTTLSCRLRFRRSGVEDQAYIITHIYNHNDNKPDINTIDPTQWLVNSGSRNKIFIRKVYMMEKWKASCFLPFPLQVNEQQHTCHRCLL